MVIMRKQIAFTIIEETFLDYKKTVFFNFSKNNKKNNNLQLSI